MSLLLGKHSEVISLGEIQNTFRQADPKKDRCTCGVRYHECPFWGRVSTDTVGVDPYQNLIEKSVDYPGGEAATYLCDSSKTLSGIERWLELTNVQLKVIFLVKDIRNYLWSQAQRSRKHEKRSKDGRTGIILNRIPVIALRWMVDNTRIQRFLGRHDIDHVRIGYEELCLRTENALEILYRFMEVPVETPATAQSTMPGVGENDIHMIKGNRMRKDIKSSSLLRYDYRWMRAGTWLNINAVPYLSANNRMVYSNHLFD